jgi:AraC-like DNA-binding protein
MMNELVHDPGASMNCSLPAPALKPYLLYYREFHAGTAVPRAIRMLPMVGCYLFLSLGMPATIEMNSLSFQAGEVLLIPGAQTWVLQPAVPFFLAGFRFSFLPYYRGIGQQHLNGMPHPARDFLPCSFLNELTQAPDFSERQSVCNHFFTPLYEKYARRIHRSAFVLEMLDALEEGRLNEQSQLREYQNYIAAKTLYRHFLRTTGTTPADALRISRMRAALKASFSSTSFDPHQFGYYDGSHFHREVEKITGMKLSDLRKNI